MKRQIARTREPRRRPVAYVWSQRFVELKARRVDRISSFKVGETFVFSINPSRDGSATGFLTTLIFRVVDCFGCGSVVDRAGHCNTRTTRSTVASLPT